MKSWFLAPDFTFTPDGPLRLGAVIPHPSRPTQTLASPRTDAITLPEVQTLVETNHSHSNDVTRTAGVNLFAKFVELASASIGYETSRRNALAYGTVDHEIRSLAAPFTREFLQSIISTEAVQEHIHSAVFGKRTVYFVSGLRVATSSFTVTKEKGIGHNTSLSGSGPAGPVPIEVGAGISSGKESSKTDSYETAPGIIFAYRLHAIRVRGSGTVDSEMFVNKKAFMHGRPVPDPEPFEVTDVDAEVLKADRKEEEDLPKYEMEDLGDEEYCFLAEA
ncbi:uncharacterized protein FFUJ_10269 [Fusarium fujikuroi IMI 58289]|uniref:Uncharacterized protein n=1 Tax=Gibberella fujikuroi (strain CBS 195.34 / IMI 58289 / NRRL A-6831) TaxID=1279085 RepID=S0EGR9_GIBF5|nr:uncharacterized protein FFUJ_10269 [Fusarium fujikuroi IMI 58289]CCT74226.1 uncharacterized protein FFUJ_10269 [Fusarium fujikuroi IMI 58289]SCO26392.1 uncharacterized protein FFM5_14661 [Fusarium fujikuroi]SCO58484.1 uncharacterized protein FFMR_15640 [Fusarium fujikuroi]